MFRSPLSALVCAAILVPLTAFAVPTGKVKNPRLQARTDFPVEPVTPIPSEPEWHVLRENGDLNLYAKDCALLGTLLNTLSQWRVRLGEPASPKPSTKYSNNFCTASIKALLPNLIRPLVHSHPAWHGPNSWNTVLVESGLLTQWRTSDDSELDYYLKSPACRALNHGEPPALGDIGVIRTSTEESPRLSHATAFVYLNQNMIFTKDDALATSPWALQTPGFALTLYGLDKTIPRCRDAQNNNNDGCPKSLTYYRCQNLRTLSNQDGWKTEPRIQAIADRILALETKVSRLVLGLEGFTEQAGEQILADHDTLFTDANALEMQLAEEGRLEEPHWFWLGKNRKALISLAYQITALFTDSRISEPQKVWYRHEPWQGAELSPALSPTTGVVQSWLTCAPWSSVCQKPQDLQPLPAPEHSGFMKH